MAAGRRPFRYRYPTRPYELNEDTDHCVSQLPGNPLPSEFLIVCDDEPMHVSRSLYCVQHECEGHPTCGPCYNLLVLRGVI